MSETVLNADAPGSGGNTAGDRLTPLLFAVAIFTSASLVFVVQPMVTKLVLPMLGGSPSVWNTSMVFFQTALLAGYAYAHALQRLKSLRTQLGVHLALLALAALFLPLKINGLLGDPDPSAPIGWLLATLVLSVGAPFAVLSATAPLLQAWFARVRAGHADGQNPYVLYAASNLGSFLALLAYPVVIEPLMTLSGQRAAWSGGYAIFMLLVVGLALVTWKRGSAPALDAAPVARSKPIAGADKIKLVLIAAAPSSLMLGVTQHLSTDVASAPFLWIIPLALYLLTFVIAFSAKPLIPLKFTFAFQAAMAAACIVLLPFRNGDWVMMFALHLGTFFITALMCHQVLAARRPAPDRLTEFFLLLSVGGVVGGVFNALIAPVIFNMVWEYPLVLVLVGLVRPWSWEPVRRVEIALLLGGILLAIVPPVALEIMRYNPPFRALFTLEQIVALAQLIFGAAVICAFLVRERSVFFTVILAVVAMGSHHIARGYVWDLSERSFFGLMRVATPQDPRLGGPVHVLMHGTTLHGAQPVDPRFACMPTLYYAPSTPLGQVMQGLQLRNDGRGVAVGVVGQGSGAMAGYKRAEDTLTFFEIDPMVDRLSRDPEWFTFITGCADGPVRTVLGDARLSMAHETAGSYDYLVIDAFSSDAVPTHLLTVEAIAGYLKLLKPDGVLLLHLSNRNLDITRPAQAAAVSLGVPYLHQIYAEQPYAADMAEASTEAIILSPTEAGLARFRSDPRWAELPDTDVKPWTDDYVNLFGSLWRHFRGQG
ncbi:spermidine synthase [Brevundimonas subvibrioides]|uniref:Putative spermine/spermidine synthase protein n=1 Tax=Brevundimonas subvibrioides (strain ATCC 15264 / DSM 4735 / LMG 14903 / NBRC 16000 / CB 81) TaxID=633149 RepID=D9QHC4_BRESC|nr:fused MFS/spermidine synthase [Brevundimonas subvibrioides]ADL01090.1 putative spermine/spermidine synthase protein [Brevundimonas subvibrioides ATCC 15264]